MINKSDQASIQSDSLSIQGNQEIKPAEGSFDLTRVENIDEALKTGASDHQQAESFYFKEYYSNKASSRSQDPIPSTDPTPSADAASGKSSSFFSSFWNSDEKTILLVCQKKGWKREDVTLISEKDERGKPVRRVVRKEDLVKNTPIEISMDSEPYPSSILDYLFDKSDESEIMSLCSINGWQRDDVILKHDQDEKGKKIRNLLHIPTLKNYAVELKTRISEINRLMSKHDLDNHIGTCIETMSDNIIGQNFISENRYSTDFSKENFIGFSEGENAALFVAEYKNGCKLELSNRSGAAELRGRKLKELLESREYTSLNDLLSKEYRGLFDPYFQYALSGFKNNINASIPLGYLKLVLEELKSEIVFGLSYQQWTTLVINGKKEYLLGIKR